MTEQRNKKRNVPNSGNPNKPNLRFPGFEEEWKSKRFGDLVDFKVTNSFSRVNLNYETGFVKNIHYGDIHTKFQTLFDITNEVVPFINEEINIDRISDENYCIEGDIIFADASEDLNDIGKSIEILNLNGEKLLSGLHTILARPKENFFYLGFIGYLFKTNLARTQVQKEAQGTKVLGLSIGRLSKIILSFPSIQEQKRIALFLSLIDARIHTQIEIIQRLESLIKGFSQLLFNQQLRFKDKKENSFSNWEEKELKKCCTFYSGGTPKSTNKAYYSGNIPFIGSGNISDSHVDIYITEKALKTSSAKLIEEGDLLYALYGATSGQVAVSKINGAINQAVLCIRTKENKNYLFYLLKHNKEKIVQTYIQGGQGNLSAKIIKELKFNFPCKEEQSRIACFLFKIDQKIQTEKLLLEQLERQKKYLLQQMFV